MRQRLRGGERKWEGRDRARWTARETERGRQGAEIQGGKGNDKDYKCPRLGTTRSKGETEKKKEGARVRGRGYRE